MDLYNTKHELQPRGADETTTADKAVRPGCAPAHLDHCRVSVIQALPPHYSGSTQTSLNFTTWGLSLLKVIDVADPVVTSKNMRDLDKDKHFFDACHHCLSAVLGVGDDIGGPVVGRNLLL